MSYVLYLRPVTETEAIGEADFSGVSYDWVLLDATGASMAAGSHQNQAAIEEALAANSIDRPHIVGVIPAFDVAYCSAKIPAKQSRFIRQALPFAVEEQVAQDIEDMHLALGRRNGDLWQVAAIDQERMSAYVELLENWHLPLNAIVADAMLLPVGKSRWSALLAGDQALITGSEGEWFDVPTAGLGLFLDSLIQGGDVDNPPVVQLYVTEEQASERQVELAALEQNPDMALQQQTLDTSALGFLARCHHDDTGQVVNLCQGPFAIRQHKESSLWRWRAVAVIAAIAVVIQLGFVVADGVYYQQRADAYDDQTLALHRDIFPDRRQPDLQTLRRNLEGSLRRAAEGGSQTDFLTLLRHAGYQYAQLDDPAQVRFESINFSRQRGEMVMDVRGDSFSRLDGIRGGLNESGLSARIGSVINEPNQTRGRITVSGGGS